VCQVTESTADSRVCRGSLTAECLATVSMYHEYVAGAGTDGMFVSFKGQLDIYMSFIVKDNMYMLFIIHKDIDMLLYDIYLLWDDFLEFTTVCETGVRSFTGDYTVCV